MNTDTKNDLIQALRSDKYGQVKGVLYSKQLSELRNKPQLCVLGVYEHISGTDLGLMDKMPMPNCLRNRLSPTLGQNAEGIDWEYVLASLNEEGHTFDQIANFIEKNL